MNPDLDLNSVWSPDFFEGIRMATNNAVMQEDRVFRQITSSRHLERDLLILMCSIDCVSYSASMHHVCGCGFEPYKRIPFVKRILPFHSPL